MKTLLIFLAAVTLLVTVLPSESSIATTGCVDNAVPPVPFPGCVVNATLVAEPGVIVRLELTALRSRPSLAVSVYEPDRSMLQPEKVATPATAERGFAAHPRVAPAGVVMSPAIP